MLQHLKGLQLGQTVKPTAKAAASPNRTPKNGAHLRVYKDGSVYPSKEAVDRFNLEYRAKDSTEQGNGFDVVDTRQWPVFPTTNPVDGSAIAPVVLIAQVSKDLPKVDLFGQTKYNEDGTPYSSVLEQGAATFGKGLIETLTAVYGLVEPFKEKNYIDLVIAEDFSFTSPDNIYFLPKTVSRGEDKGKPTVQRREYLTLFPLVPFNLTEESAEGTVSTSETSDAVVVSSTGEEELG